MIRFNYLFVLICLTFSCNPKKVDNPIKVMTVCDTLRTKSNSNIFGTNIYKNLSPNEFLNYIYNHRKGFNKFGFITFGQAPANWINEKDIDTLIQRVQDTTKIPCLVNPLSSYLPIKMNSCIGREAQNMIESYINKVGYLDFLYSCGQVDSLNARKLIEWYKNK
jgi:hypothetical protein